MDYALSRAGVPWLKAAERSSFIGRFVGWMGQTREGLKDQALWFPDCHTLQTTFMRFKLDVYFLDASKKVLSRRLNVGAFRFLMCPGADSALEMPSGAVVVVEEGESLGFVRCV